MKTLVALVFVASSLAACASTGSGLPDRDGKTPTGPGSDLDLDPRSPDDAKQDFPKRVSEVDLSRVDRMSHRINVEHGGTVRAQVKLCVAPTGSVADVDLVASSGMPEYDDAVVDAAAGWQYAAYPAPAGTRVCQDVTVAYRAP